MGRGGQVITRWRDQFLLSRIGQQLTGRTLKARLIRGTGGTFVLRIGNTGLQFLTSLILARWLGQEQFGVYNFALAWVTILVVPSISGLDRLLIRNMAVYRSQLNWRMMRGLYRFANRFAIGTSVTLTVVGFGIGWTTYHFMGRPAFFNTPSPQLAETALVALVIALLLLPLRTVLMLQQAAMQGLRHVVVGQVPEQLLQPLLFLLVASSLYLLSHATSSATWASSVQVLTTLVALGVGVYLLQRRIPPSMRLASPQTQARLWLIGALPFAISRGLTILDTQINTLMVGAFSTAEEVALYSVSQRVSQFIILLLMSANVALAPTIAELFSEGRRHDLQRVMTQGARVVLAGALPIALVFFLFGKNILAIFGSQYPSAHGTLIILSVGQLINAATGLVGLLLLMTNREREAMLGIALGVGAHILANLVLIPRWGIEGAAAGTAISLLLANLFQMGIAWKYLGIHTTVLGNMSWLRQRNG